MPSITRDTSFNAVSRDEMNLVEFPISVLSKRVDPKVKTLEFTDYITSARGDKVERKWIITGADKFGLPTSSDDEVLLGLLKLSVDSGLKDRKVHFTRYELLRVLKWSTEGRSYNRLQRALDRLSGVRIKASNSFYDNDSKLYKTRNFGLIDEYEISSARTGDLPSSYFVWSDVLYNSFQVGFIKKLDLNFYLSLKTAVAKRLFRYLDKHFWHRPIITKPLFPLCHEKLGVSRNYKYASSLIQQIEPGLEELVEREFLTSVKFIGRGKHTQVVLASKQDVLVSVPKGGQLNSGGIEDVIKDLIARGLKPTQAQKLLTSKSEGEIEKIQGIVRYYDFLRSTNSSLINRSPIGFLYKAVQNCDEFNLPGKFLLGSSEKLSAYSSVKKKRKQPQAVVTEKGEPDYDSVSKQHSPEVIEKVTLEVESALYRLRGVISHRRFAEAVKHGVAKKLAALSKK